MVAVLSSLVTLQTNYT